MAPSATSDLAPSSVPSKIDFTTYRNVINGKLVDSAKHHQGVNPATKEKLWDVPVATKDDLDDAVKAARTAFKKWRRSTKAERDACLNKYADAIEANHAELVKLLTTEQGKPTFQAEIEIGGAPAWVRGSTALELKEDVLVDDDEKKVVVRYTPLGVVGAIVPWNFPVLLAIGKIAPATAAGNCIIVKPSPFTPYTALKLAELAIPCFPPGVVQVLGGDDSLGPWMTAHEGIDKISFTGSTATGKRVAAAAAATMKRVTLECGGNDPAIVCASVKDIPAVAAGVATSALLNSGQICMAIKRVYVQKSIYNEFRDAMVAHVKSLKVGDGFAADTFMGPIQNEMQYEKVKGFMKEVSDSGLKLAMGGQHVESAGFFIQPTIVDNPPDSAPIVHQEPFGPILPLMSFETEEEVIERANDTDMGLGASIWSGDEEEAQRMAAQIESGTVWINHHMDPSPLVPFGGHKASGMGVEWGINGLKGMCNSQTICLSKTAKF